MDGLDPVVTLNVRFQEWQYYDITRDCEVIMFQAISEMGTWTAEYPVSSQHELRIKRKGFQDTVLGFMAQGTKPHEVELTFG